MSSEVRLTPKERRAILAQLSRDRLGELTTRFELEVADRRSVEAHVDAIVRKRSLDFREVLEVLQREELQGVCEALGLEASGREKAKLVARILRHEDEQPAEEPRPSSSRRPGARSMSGRRRKRWPTIR